jgi:hypothetical protein
MSANIRHSSESVEFYTPEWLVEAARYVLGGIDCDPASSEFANQVVRAPTIYTAERNGLWAPKWEGRVLLNPPGGIVDCEGYPVIKSRTVDGVRLPGCSETGACGKPPGHKHRGLMSSAVLFWRVLCKQWEMGNASAAFFVGFSLEMMQTCQGGPKPGHHPLDFRTCVPKDRIPFDVVIDGLRQPAKDPTHSNFLPILPATSASGHLDVAMLSRFDEAMASVGYINRGNQYA